jgi:hypothetical protein
MLVYHYYWLHQLVDKRVTQFVTDTQGEPLNVIISARSDPFVLTDYGLRYYTK